MSGLLALLDDVAAIAKVAAASVDDVVGQAAKAGSKAAGAVIDDAAVTPKYVQGFAPARELPVIWRITKGSLKNKLLFLLPAALALSAFAPWLIMPLLMLGGGYLVYEGAEKLAHSWGMAAQAAPVTEATKELDAAHLEEQKAQGAIKTDFILSAEIMTIALAAIPPTGFWMQAAILATVAVMITVAVYGTVALIVKADDLGLALARHGQLAPTRAFGRGLVQAMPAVLKTLSLVGTAAMLWVGGAILVHGLADLGWDWPYKTIHHMADNVANAADASFEGFVSWLVTAAFDGLVGLAIGLGLVKLLARLFPAIGQAH